MTDVLISVSGLGLRFQNDRLSTIEPRFAAFVSPSGESRYIIRFRRVDALELPSGPAVASCDCYDVRFEGGGFCRCFLDATQDGRFYAVSRLDWEQKQVRVDYLPLGDELVSQLGNCIVLSQWETVLLHENRLFLHAACVDTPLGGLLFSGPSGVGKSTQANLWTEYMGASLLNGDRPILSRDEMGWLAWGSPYAGSSHVHVNASVPVRAIVLLRQAPENSLRRLSGREAFTRVFAGVTVNSWDPWCMNRACDLVMELTAAVPVYELSCTPTKEAVDLLHAALTGGEAR